MCVTSEAHPNSRKGPCGNAHLYREGGTCPTGTAYPHKKRGQASQGIHGIAHSL